MIRLIPSLTLLLALLITAAADAKRYDEMDYGPILGTSMHLPPKGNLVYRGYVVRVGDEQQATVCYDGDTLRMAAAWSGGFIDWKGVVFKGNHGGAPGLSGRHWLSTVAGPGWAKGGKLDDPRFDPEDNPFPPAGNLPEDWAELRGYAMHGDRVILHYTVGEANVLESPWHEPAAGGFITRSFTIEPDGGPMKLVLAETDKAAVNVAGGVVRIGAPPTASEIRGVEADDLKLEMKEVPGGRLPDAADVEETEADGDGAQPDEAGRYVALIGAADLPDGAAFELEPVAHKASAKGRLRTLFKGRRIVLKLPAARKAYSFKVLLWNNDIRLYDDALAHLKTAKSEGDLSELTEGGPRRWPQTVTTEGRLGDEDRAYAVDRITVPYANPYKSWMRLGGVDFFSDGTTAAVSTWSGDVWIVKGVDDDLDKLEWSRFATGLHQPLGLKIVDDHVYTIGHDQITKLHDRNNDGEADYYENFNNDWHITSAFHAFAFDLHTGPDGWFYFALGAPVRGGGRSFERITKHHGKVLRISPDGRKLETYASGFRAPNGIGVHPETGQVTTGDNQGTYVPNCPINWCSPGSWHGVVDTATPAWKRKLESRSSQRGGKSFRKDAPQPLAWLPMRTDNSGGGQAWALTDRWGPFKDRLLHGSYGKSSVYLVTHEVIDGVRQGGVIHLPHARLTSSAMRLRFNEHDGQLYVAGLKGWQTNAGRPGGLDRIRCTGKPVRLPSDIRVTDKAVRVTFTCQLDRASAEDVENWSNEVYNIRWTSAYGSGEFRPDNGEKGHVKRQIIAASLSDDRRTVTLVIPELSPVTHSMIRFKNVTAADGGKIDSAIDHTIHVTNEETDPVVLELVDRWKMEQAAREAAAKAEAAEDELVDQIEDAAGEPTADEAVEPPAAP